MSTAKLNPCPYCNPFDHELEFVEISTRNFESGIAVECMSCGCRSMAADKSDGEEMAVSLWNSMSVSNNACTPTVGTHPQSELLSAPKHGTGIEYLSAQPHSG